MEWKEKLSQVKSAFSVTVITEPLRCQGRGMQAVGMQGKGCAFFESAALIHALLSCPNIIVC